MTDIHICDLRQSAYNAKLERFRSYALEHANGNARMLACAECLDTLLHGAPSNTYEVLQLIYLFFMFGEHIDRFQVRSLGNIDRTIYPYWTRDIEEGRYTMESPQSTSTRRLWPAISAT